MAVPKLSCKIGGAVKNIADMYTKVNGVWKPINAAYKKENAWKGNRFLDILEYIESSGTQYINSGFKPNQNTRVIMDIEILSTSGTTCAIFGGRNATGTSNNSFVLWKISQSAFRSDYRSNTLNISVTPTGRHLIDKNKNSTNIDGTTVTHTAGTFQSSYPLVIFANNGLGTIESRKVHARLYYCQIYDNNTLIRDYLPIRTEDGQVGLIDMLTETFYPNLGTGSFTAGPSV